MQLNSNNAIVYSQENCPWCDSAKALLRHYNFNIEERKLTQAGPWTKETLQTHLPGVRSVPQIVIGDKHIGGFTELQKALQNGLLEMDW
jgi:glutaredoxin 3